jgi:multicomponent Na+:H+ antiporter subunit C
MNSALLFSLAGVWIAVIGLRGVLLEIDLLRRILAAGVLGTGIFLVLVAMARRMPEGPPDPVPHGMVLTGLVVSVSAIGLLLGLMGRLRDLEEDER